MWKLRLSFTVISDVYKSFILNNETKHLLSFVLL